MPRNSLNITSYHGKWLTVALVPIRRKRREGKQTEASFTTEVAGLEYILSSCVRQVKERYRAKQPKGEREQPEGEREQPGEEGGTERLCPRRGTGG